MKYKNTTQNARKKFLLQKRLSQKEQGIIKKDFKGKDYVYYELIKDKEIFLPEQYSSGVTYNKIKQSIQSGIYRFQFIRYAAVIALLMTTTLGIYHFNSNRPVKNVLVSTSYGERKQIDLTDGSAIILNSLSSVSYPEKIHKRRTREIELHGEAYFDVEKDTQRPFIVKASNVEIRVLGTKFNISSYENDENITTNLYEGSVSISAGQDNFQQLKPGEKAIFNKETDKVEILAIEDKNNSAWINGSINFENIPLENIFKILEREKNVTFLISEEVDKELKLTAKFSGNESVDEILEQLSLPAIFKFEKKENIYIINKPKY